MTYVISTRQMAGSNTGCKEVLSGTYTPTQLKWIISLSHYEDMEGIFYLFFKETMFVFFKNPCDL